MSQSMWGPVNDVCEFLNNTIVNNLILTICFHHFPEYLIAILNTNTWLVAEYLNLLINNKTHF